MTIYHSGLLFWATQYIVTFQYIHQHDDEQNKSLLQKRFRRRKDNTVYIRGGSM